MFARCDRIVISFSVFSNPEALGYAFRARFVTPTRRQILYSLGRAVFTVHKRAQIRSNGSVAGVRALGSLEISPRIIFKHVALDYRRRTVTMSLHRSI